MAWSTREVAELAGTSLRAVRHYHDIGLLDEPRRRANGYKQYGVEHLLRLVKIRRLTDLGFSLSQIAAMDNSDGHPESALRALDAELAATIERLQRARTEVHGILDRSAPLDLPPGFIAPDAAAQLSDADRALVVVLTRVLGPQGLQVYRELLSHAPADASAAAFDHLPADADETTRQALAERLAPNMEAVRAAHPALREAGTDAPRGARFAQRAIDAAVAELYNPAQLDVLRRAGNLSTKPDSASA